MTLDHRTLQIGSLVVLAVQTSAFVLVARRSRLPDANGNVYFAGTAVFLMELTKLLTSALMLTITAYTNAASGRTSNTGYRSLEMSKEDPSSYTPILERHTKAKLIFIEVKRLLWTPSALWLAVPAAAYVAQNNLQLFAASYLEPALFQTFTQAKLITTAGFSILIMKRSLHKFQWASIALLAIGLTIVHQAATSSQAIGRKGDPNKSNVTFGFVLMMLAAILSGFAGVFTERMLKQNRDFWATNFHMAAFSMLPALGVIASTWLSDTQFHPFDRFGGWAWATVLLNALGGLIVSMVLKYADSIAKGFSLAAAVVLTVFLNVTFFDAHFTFGCLFGILTVLLSTVLYVAVGSLSSNVRTSEHVLPTTLNPTEAHSTIDKKQKSDSV